MWLSRGTVGATRDINGPNATNTASPGYIVLQTSGTPTGTTDPVANVIP